MEYAEAQTPIGFRVSVQHIRFDSIRFASIRFVSFRSSLTHRRVSVARTVKGLAHPFFDILIWYRSYPTNGYGSTTTRIHSTPPIRRHPPVSEREPPASKQARNNNSNSNYYNAASARAASNAVAIAVSVSVSVSASVTVDTRSVAEEWEQEIYRAPRAAPFAAAAAAAEMRGGGGGGGESTLPLRCDRRGNRRAHYGL